jgi:general nucleoside transport system ATP-binding protein
MKTAIRMECITKRFPRVVANDNVTVELKKGEIHALLGENGAGKSTLMNCLYGMYQPDEGTIYVNEKKVNIRNSDDAIRLGIGMVHQHFMLIPELTVTENIVLGLKSQKEPLLDLKNVEKEIQKLSDQYNFNINPRALIKDLPVGMQQRVEIMKTLYRKADILILDEATAVLIPQEVDELFNVIRQLAREGKSILMIVHKLEEVMEVCDTVTILRDGKLVGNVKVSETNTKELARMMVGREVFLDFNKKPCEPKEVALSVKDLVITNRHGINVVNGVSFELRKGEILGIAGVEGNGQIELSEAITGLSNYCSGQILVDGQEVKHHNTRSFIEKGISHIPQDRQHTGLVLDFSIRENLILEEFCKKPYSKNGILKENVIQKHADEMIAEFNIKASGADVQASTLSGGNQQKVILAREINRHHTVLVAVQPTRGLDIGAIEFVRKQIIDERDKGIAIILISTELDEVMALSDRIAIMHKGKFMGIVNPKEVTIEEIGLMMAGVKKLN